MEQRLGRHSIAKKMILIVGSANSTACIPPEAILGSIDVRKLARPEWEKNMNNKEYQKRLPERTTTELKEFEQRMNEINRQADAAEPSRVDRERTIQKTKTKWHRDEVKRQFIAHNPLLEDGSELARRSTKNTELIAIKWAKEGVSRIRHILEENGNTILSADKFVLKYPNLASSRGIQRDIRETAEIHTKSWDNTRRGQMVLKRPGELYRNMDG